MADSTNVCISWHDSRLQSWDDMMKPGDPAPMGTTGPSDARHQHTAILRHLFNANLKMIPGYKGSGEVRLAMERGEIAGNCGDSWSSLKSTAADWLKEKKINVLAQFAIRSHPDLPDVPLIMDETKDPQELAALKLIFGRQSIARPYATAPGVPPDRVAALRKAFDDTMKDKAFLEEAQKTDLEVQPVSGADVQALVAEVYKSSPEVVKIAAAAAKTGN
jgi:tripartite-type tricarboxylate transporter receptor subunit TctC